jgi:hypothetical protein
MFYKLPFLLAAVALLPAFQVRPLRIATEWSRERVCLVVTVLATILLYQGVQQIKLRYDRQDYFVLLR